MNTPSHLPLVSVVIPTFNYARFLGEAIESALNQTYPGIEVIVMDDGSTDHTPEVAAGFASRIRYVREPNRGVYSTRQASLEHVHGDYFLNLDADNRLHPEFVARTVARLQGEADAKCVFVYTQRQYFGDHAGESHFPDYDLPLLKQKNYIDMGSLIRTDVVRRFGFDPLFNAGYGDYDFFLTLAEHGFHGVRLDEPLIFYRVHGSSITQSVNKTYLQVAIIRKLLRKHRALFSPSEKRRAIQAARQRLQLALVLNRLPGRSLRERGIDLRTMLCNPVSLAQIWEQVKYTFGSPLQPRKGAGP